MDIRIEALMRAVALFLSVYFTLDWGRSSAPVWDTPVMIASIIAAVVVYYRSSL
jgi:hypothetical protein